MVDWGDGSFRRWWCMLVTKLSDLKALFGELQVGTDGGAVGHSIPRPITISGRFYDEIRYGGRYQLPPNCAHIRGKSAWLID
jgi:hypothetical protein